MPFINNIFRCSSQRNNEELVKNIEKGRVERIFMKQQLEEIKKDVKQISAKAVGFFGLDKDIAVMKRDLSYIQRDMEYFKGYIMKLPNRN